MLTERVLLTALPARVDRDADLAHLSVFATLRVTSDAEPQATVGDTGYFERWPEVLATLLDDVRLEVDGANAIPAHLVSAQPSMELWRAIFPRELLVQAYETEEYVHRPIATYAAGLLHDYVAERLARAALESPTALPPGDQLPAMLGEAVDTWSSLLHLPRVDGRERPGRAARERFARLFSVPLADRLAERIEGDLTRAREVARTRRLESGGQVIDTGGDYVSATPTPVGNTPVSRELHRFLTFHSHRRAEQEPVPLPTPAQLAQELDFHKVQTALAAYRFLLLRTGLVVELAVPLGELRAAGAIDPGRLRVVVGRRAAAAAGELPALDAPWTAFRLATIGEFDVFRPASRRDAVHAHIDLGLLDVAERRRFRLAQIDVDSAAFKTLNAAMTGMTKLLLPRPVGTPDPEGLPALHSTGIALLHEDRARSLNAQLAHGHNNMLGLGTDEPPTLYAEDVTRGYRVDVDAGDAWRSLHERRGRYRLVGEHEGELDEEHEDEGFVQLALREPALPPGAAPDPDGEVHLHESMARWEGWSLAAPRPGLGLSRSPQGPTEGEPETQPVPSTSPALPDGVPLEVEFHASPHSLPRLRFGSRYRVRVRAVDLSGDGPSIAEADDLLRALEAAGAPVPVLPAEPDGPLPFRRVDPVPAPVVVARKAADEGESVAHVAIRSDHDRTTAQYAAATGYPERTDRHVAPPKTSQQLAELHGRFDDAIGHDDDGPLAAAYKIASREAGRLDTLEPGDRLELPYLPDPFSAGTAFVGLPGLPDGVIASFDAAGTLVTTPQPSLPGVAAGPSVTVLGWGEPPVWWQAEPFRLEVVEGDAAPSFDPASRVLTAALPKGMRVDVQLSSLVERESLEQIGPYQDMLALLAAEPPADPDGTRAALERLAVNGRVWALTPTHALTLVHAVQHPVYAPKLLVLRPLRFPGMTAAVLVGEIRVHGASTVKVDVVGRWTEWRDLAPDPPDQNVANEAAALTVDVHLARDRIDEPPPEEGTSSGRYEEADDLLVLGADGEQDGQPAYLSLHEFRDTRHRTIRYRAIASSRFREYFRPELTQPPGATTRESAEIEVDVPSSAPPPPPRLLYAVPMFGWERSGSPDGVARVSRRRGGGLRLFLERPWYTSGDGELLAALIDPCPDGHRSLPAELVTQWGYDPLWNSSPPPPAPLPSHFARRVQVGDDLSLTGSGKVTAVGHAVEYDASRNLWTCDVELDLGAAYFPFVRLALARYQPSSVPGAHLSPVVVARFAQVAPERTVMVALEQDDGRLVSVAVTGPAHGPALDAASASADRWSGSEFDLWVERRVEGVDDPDLGWERVADAVLDTDARPEWFGEFVRWSGRAILPADHSPGLHRVVVAEYERFVADAPRRPSLKKRAAMFEPAETTVMLEELAAFKGFGRRHATTRRLVFAETFVL